MLRKVMRTIFRSQSGSKADPWAPIVALATEKAIDGTDPRLRALRRYKDELREAVTRAVHFANDLGEGFAPPVALDRGTFASDPCTRAFFSSFDRIQEVFSTSLDVQSFIAEPGHRARERFHVALAMRLSEREVLAPALSGDQIRRDVKRTLASFDEHRIVLPSVDEATLRRQLKERAFTTLVECALERLAERDERKQALEKQRALLRAKLRALRSARCGLDAMSPGDGGTADPTSVEQALEETERALQQAAASGGVLERNLEELRDTLARPEEFLQLSPASRRLTRMGYVADESESGSCDVVEFNQLTIRGRPLVSGALASFSVSEVRSTDVYADKARRALGTRTGPGS